MPRTTPAVKTTMTIRRLVLSSSFFVRVGFVHDRDQLQGSRVHLSLLLHCVSLFLAHSRLADD
jgi:hypothetical protein